MSAQTQGQPQMRDIVFAQAVRTALLEEMRRDQRVILMGEDIGLYGGVYGTSRGLLNIFGEARVRDTPISEAGIVGLAIGAALAGLRPVAEIMYCDFMTQASDMLVNNAAKLRYMSGGQIAVPLVVRTPAGGGVGNAAQHSQCLEAWFAHVPGLKVVMPSTPADARGLLKAAIRDDNPVLFIEHKAMYKLHGLVPAEEEVIPLGVAEVKRPGNDVTLVSWSKTLLDCLEAAESLAKEGIEVEVVDPRTLQPLDVQTILGSVSKTGRLVVAHEAVCFGGFGGEIVAQVAQRLHGRLKSAPLRVGARFAPVPFAQPLEKHILPHVSDILAALKQSLL
jgi:pyruvate/2-oxoglutarate/acetoin dehydrogenase E1 component